MKHLAITLMLAIGMMATAAEARRYNLQLNFGDAEIDGTNVIHLKRAIERAFPNIDTRDLELLSVRLVSKSRSGKGAAYLTVGRNSTASQRIDGNTVKWYLDHEQTFEKNDFTNPTRRSSQWDAWQIVTGGRLKVRRMIVAVEEFGNPNNPRDPRDPREPRDPRDPRDRDPRDPPRREPREPRDPRREPGRDNEQGRDLPIIERALTK